jgi:hypothetical protein
MTARNPEAPYHRRTLDEKCQACGAEPGAACTDQRPGLGFARETNRPHRYRPEVGR